MKIGWQLTKLLQKLSGLLFLAHPVYPHILYIFEKLRSHAYILQWTILVYLRWNFSGGLRNFCSFLQEGRFGRSRSFKVSNVGAKRKHVCDFLLVRNSNLGPILQRFGDQTGFMCFWPHPYSIRIFWGVPVAPDQWRRAIEALEARAPPQTVLRLWLIRRVRGKRSQFSLHNFSKCRHSFLIFGMNHPEDSFY